jgi:hypothetical protein
MATSWFDLWTSLDHSESAYFVNPPADDDDDPLGCQKYVMKINPRNIDDIMNEHGGLLDDLTDSLWAGKIMRGRTDDCLLVLYPLHGCDIQVSDRLIQEVDEKPWIYTTFRPLNTNDLQDGRLWTGPSDKGDAQCLFVH